jgi:pimeloyl-ACP methyl ester carboxylesterase
VYTLDAKQTQEQKVPVYVMHHGAGAGALSFGLVARRIHNELQGACAVMALDCRGHGKTAIKLVLGLLIILFLDTRAHHHDRRYEL